MERIPNAGPWVTEKEVAYATEAARHAWYSNANMFHERFERAFAEYVGVKHAITFPHCTSAIHLALVALGIGPGDEVIVPELTWIASAAPIRYVGASTVFADVDPKTLCLSAESFERCITRRTKAVIPVELYGSMPDWDALTAIAREHRIAMVEDAAEAIGSEYHGHKAGSLGDAGVFSFHGAKTLTTGEGGMLTTNRQDLHDRVRILRDHGRSPTDSTFFFNAEVAYKCKMSSMQAAFGLAQLERIDELIERKREMFFWYQEELAGIPGLTLNQEPAGTRNSYWMTNVLIDPSYGVTKDDVRSHLEADAIDYRPLFYPLSSLPAYANDPGIEGARERNSVAYALAPYGVNLPSPFSLTRDQVARVGRALRRALRLEPR